MIAPKRPRGYSTAVHEAGHAVFALHFGHRFRRVTIVPSKDYLGVVVHFRQRSEFRRVTMESALQVAMCALAGRIAERAAGFRSAHRSWHGDRANAVMAFDDIAGSPAEVECWVKLAYVRATALEKRLRPCIDELARALLARRRLSEAECRQVVEAGRRARHPAHDLTVNGERVRIAPDAHIGPARTRRAGHFGASHDEG